MTIGKKIAAFSALASFTIIVGAILVEIGLRVVGVSYPSLFDLDIHRGNALHPNAEGWYRKEGESYVRINSQGLNDREHDIEKPAGTFRIAVLGDSYAAALHVPNENAFWAVLEKQLSSCPAFMGTRIEALNFGISGHGTTQEYLTLKHYGWQYSPDLVMIAFYTATTSAIIRAPWKKQPIVPTSSSMATSWSSITSSGNYQITPRIGSPGSDSETTSLMRPARFSCCGHHTSASKIGRRSPRFQPGPKPESITRFFRHQKRLNGRRLGG